ncbi:unnamed protein product [Haemonchus placei]|uniref:Ovule protein n=1 Tax=Haemonchus placei TaxID=6290 RepID=A0A0N4W1J9_HAEPC|nr:unnamed protein product [Haemonchus placei]
MLEVGQIVYAHSVDVFFSREDMEWIFSSSIQHDVCSALRKIVLAQPLLLSHMGLCLLLPVKGMTTDSKTMTYVGSQNSALTFPDC